MDQCPTTTAPSHPVCCAEAQKAWTKRTRERSQSTTDPLRLTLRLVSTPPTIARGQSVKPPACHSHPLPRHSTLTSHRHDAPPPSTSPYASTLHSPPICAGLYSSAPSIPTLPSRRLPSDSHPTIRPLTQHNPLFPIALSPSGALVSGTLKPRPQLARTTSDRYANGLPPPWLV
jgi:hypothetical protein